jgi:cytochrome P450
MEGMKNSPRVSDVTLNMCRKGDAHRRHRKVMQPAFGVSETRALYPAFQEVAVRVRHTLLFLHEPYPLM